MYGYYLDSNSHPDIEALAGYVFGFDLGEDTFTAIDQHLENCRCCSEVTLDPDLLLVEI